MNGRARVRVCVGALGVERERERERFLCVFVLSARGDARGRGWKGNRIRSIV